MNKPTIDLRKEKNNSEGPTTLSALITAIILVSVLILGWSVWYWTHYPESYTSTVEIHERCEEDSTTPYCYGYAAGYNWCVDQVEIEKKTKEDIDINYMLPR